MLNIFLFQGKPGPKGSKGNPGKQGVMVIQLLLDLYILPKGKSVIFDIVYISFSSLRGRMGLLVKKEMLQDLDPK